MNNNIKYIRHIDGLRGIAVLLVLFFHLEYDLFSGGFIGVDVFFVISGFLITKKLINEIDHGHFIYIAFLKNRLRRLSPTLIITTLFVFIAGIIIFPLYRFEMLSETIPAALLSFSNILFKKQAGYFETSSDLKPLLHTWSLSVEVQFYLFWPLILLYLRKFNVSYKYIILSAIAISFILGEYFITKNTAKVFFLTPFRIWEFMFGAMLIYPLKLKNIYTELVTALALSCIVYLAINYTPHTIFPSFNAILPCLCTGILIKYSSNTFVGQKILQNKVLLKTGELSYALYLVHWPVIVFYKYYYFREINNIDKLIISCIAIMLSILIHYLVEKKFRKTVSFKINSIYIIPFILVLSLTLLLPLINTKEIGFFNNRTRVSFSKNEVNLGKKKRFYASKNITHNKDKDVKNILIIGDSHAPDALNFLSIAYPDFNYHLKTLGGCPPITEKDLSILNNHTIDLKNKCTTFNEEYINLITKNNFDYIVINVLFGWYNDKHLINYINKIKENSNTPILVFGNHIIFKSELLDLISKKESISTKDIESVGLYDLELKKASDKHKFTFISKKDLFDINDYTDIKITELIYFQEPLTYDTNHLSYGACKHIANKIVSLGLLK